MRFIFFLVRLGYSFSVGIVVNASHIADGRQIHEGPTMYLLGIGIVLLLLKSLEVSPVVHWSWWWILAPFGLALLWWAWADRSGFTKRREMARMQARQAERVDRKRSKLGLPPRKSP
jgi:small Trp-rich protein